MQNHGHDHDSGFRNLKEAPEMNFFGKKEGVHYRHNIFKLRELTGSE
jgi:hypothetical protein